MLIRRCGEGGDASPKTIRVATSDVKQAREPIWTPKFTCRYLFLSIIKLGVLTRRSYFQSIASFSSRSLISIFPYGRRLDTLAQMVDTVMDVDQAPLAPSNPMEALVANAKGKAKATNGNGNGTMSEAELKAVNEREGLPWSVARGPSRVHAQKTTRRLTASGWRSTDRIRWTRWSRIRISPAPVSTEIYGEQSLAAPRDGLCVLTL